MPRPNAYECQKDRSVQRQSGKWRYRSGNDVVVNRSGATFPSAVYHARTRFYPEFRLTVEYTVHVCINEKLCKHQWNRERTQFNDASVVASSNFSLLSVSTLFMRWVSSQHSTNFRSLVKIIVYQTWVNTLANTY